MDFVALDIETANPDLASICQVGVVTFRDGSVAEAWSRLVDPEDEFSPWNVAVHGISADDVHGAPTFPQLLPELRARLDGAVVACHTAFDRVSLSRAAARHRVAEPTCTWLDTARVVRRAWPQYARGGYSLANVCEAFQITFRHHDAGEDARAAGEILLRAVRETGLDVGEWVVRTRQPISGSDTRIERQGNPDGPLAGEVVVFTGALSLPRRHAADLAAKVGCAVAGGVTKHTTLLVVGDQDLRRLAGHEQSAKHRETEKLIAAGQPIRILQESDFLELCGCEAASGSVPSLSSSR